MSNWDRLVEEKIQKAFKDGEFDNLPGKGRPLNLGQDPFTDPDMRLAYHVLKSSGYTLPWIEERREIEADIQALRAGLRRAWQWYRSVQTAGAARAEWQRLEQAFRRQLEELNRRIVHYNLMTPTHLTQRPTLDVEAELAQSREAVDG